MQNTRSSPRRHVHSAYFVRRLQPKASTSSLLIFKSYCWHVADSYNKPTIPWLSLYSPSRLQRYFQGKCTKASGLNSSFFRNNNGFTQTLLQLWHSTQTADTRWHSYQLCLGVWGCLCLSPFTTAPAQTTSVLLKQTATNSILAWLDPIHCSHCLWLLWPKMSIWRYFRCKIKRKNP